MHDIRILSADDAPLLMNVRKGLFDHRLRRDQTIAFLENPLNAIAAAFEGDDMVAFASGTVLLHPDKLPGFFINEVGTRESHRRRGFGFAVTQALIDHARDRDCDGIWLGTEPDNHAALALYRKLDGEECPLVGFGWDDAFALD